MYILERLFGHKKARVAPCDDELDRLVARVVVLHPPLLRARDHEARLRSAMARSVDYLRGLMTELPPPRAANVHGWTTDPYIRAFFAAPSELTNALARSPDLRKFFDASPGLKEGYAVLGMQMTERRTLGVSQEGGLTRSDVAQATLSFGDHQLRICGSTVSALRDEIVGRMVDQIGIEALAHIADEGKRRDMLEREHAMLLTRLKILERQGAGMRSVAGGGTQADAGELARLSARMDENNLGLRSLGLLSPALDRQLDCFCEFFSDPGRRMHVTAKRVRLGRMNIVVAEDAPEDAHTLDLLIARVPGNPPCERSFALVHVARADVPQPANLLEEAARLLG